MKLKKAFTLIELLLALFLASILLYFGFSYQFNFLKEIKYLEDKEFVSRESFRLSDYLIKGVVVEEDKDYIPGVISLSNLNSSQKYQAHVSNKLIEYSIDEEQIQVYDKNHKESFFYNRIDISTVGLSQLEDKNNNSDKGIYSLGLNTSYSSFDYEKISNPTLNNYTRLIYTK